MGKNRLLDSLFVIAMVQLLAALFNISTRIGVIAIVPVIIVLILSGKVGLFGAPVWPLRPFQSRTIQNIYSFVFGVAYLLFGTAIIGPMIAKFIGGLGLATGTQGSPLMFVLMLPFMALASVPLIKFTVVFNKEKGQTAFAILAIVYMLIVFILAGQISGMPASGIYHYKGLVDALLWSGVLGVLPVGAFIYGMFTANKFDLANLFTKRPEINRTTVIGFVVFLIDMLVNRHTAVFNFTMSGLFTSITAGVVEELTFRVGVFFFALVVFKHVTNNNQRRLVYAAVTESVLFGLVHLSNLSFGATYVIFQVLLAVSVGMTFVGFLANTKSIFVPMVLHFLWDFWTATGNTSGEINASMSGFDWPTAIQITIIFVLNITMYVILTRGKATDLLANVDR